MSAALSAGPVASPPRSKAAAPSDAMIRPDALGAGRAPALRPRAARLATVLPLLAMPLGLLLPELAALANRATPVWLAATTLLSVLALPRGSTGSGVGLGVPLRAVVALGCLAPLLCWGAALLLAVEAPLTPWLVLAAGAPVGTGAIGLAVALGLSGGRVAVAVVASTVLAPVLLPLATWLLPCGQGVPAPASQVLLDGMPALLAERLWLLAVLPALLAWPLRRRLPPAGGEVRRCCAVAVVVLLALTALARMQGLGPVLAADPAGALRLLALACLPGLAGVAALLLLGGRSLPQSLLCGGYRNVSLVWAAAEPFLTAEGRLLMALAALPVFATPALAALFCAGGRGARDG